jgi:hypothetical protein
MTPRQTGKSIPKSGTGFLSRVHIGDNRKDRRRRENTENNIPSYTSVTAILPSTVNRWGHGCRENENEKRRRGMATRDRTIGRCTFGGIRLTLLAATTRTLQPTYDLTKEWQIATQHANLWGPSPFPFENDALDQWRSTYPVKQCKSIICFTFGSGGARNEGICNCSMSR